MYDLSIMGDRYNPYYDKMALLDMDKYRTSIKKEFGTEPEFTGWLANNKEATEKLLEITELDIEDDYQVNAEDFTADGKRIDFTIGDDKKTKAVVESQDANGWLDQHHLYKTLGYMHDKETDKGIILCEDASGDMINKVNDINENFEGKNIWLIYIRLYKINNEVLVEFIVVVRPYDEKPGRRNVSLASDIDYSENKVIIDRLWQKHGDYLTGRAHKDGGMGKRWYAYKQFLDDKKILLSFDLRHPGSKKPKFYVGFYSKSGKFKSDWDEDSKNEFIRIAKEFGCEVKLGNQNRAYVNLNDEEKAVEFSKSLLESYKNGKITFDW